MLRVIFLVKSDEIRHQENVCESNYAEIQAYIVTNTQHPIHIQMKAKKTKMTTNKSWNGVKVRIAVYSWERKTSASRRELRMKENLETLGVNF